MIEYLIIHLDDTSTSYCHYKNLSTSRRLISLEALKAGIFFAMKENLMIQFVYPDYTLPKEYKAAIEEIDHNVIVSSRCQDETVRMEADVIVLHDWSELSNGLLAEDKCYVLHTSKEDLFDNYLVIADNLEKVLRLNVVISDIETFGETDFEIYQRILHFLSQHIEMLYAKGKTPQLNLLTDRMLLSKMNNCGAGVSNITLAPNGKFYVCPAFYYEDETDDIGDLEHGLNIRNKQLYRLDHAPICRHCEAWHCKRCVWLNRKTTLEVNTPSHEQCVMAHLERNASRDLLHKLHESGMLRHIEERFIEISYLDPFENRDNW